MGADELRGKVRGGIGRRRLLQAVAAGAGGALLGFGPGAAAQQGEAPATLAAASAALREGRFSSVELVEYCLARIARFDEGLNTFITVARELALETARQRDAEAAAGRRRGPLHGVPIALKDNIDTADIRTTGASALFEERFPSEDAEVARRLKEAGAVILGKLNLHEFAYGGSSTVTHYGTMRNPWNTDYVTGGSSGGPGAAVAAGLCYAALGTDTAGSVRGPAAHCGIVGLKPTYGLVSTRGVITLSWTLDHVGPMCRTVEDTALMLNAIAGHDPLEPNSADRPPLDYLQALGGGAAGLRLGIPRSPFYENLDPEVAAAMERALDLLQGLGASLSEVELPRAGAPSTPSTIWDAEAYVWHREWISSRPELYQSGTRNTLERAAQAPAWEYAAARREVEELRSRVGAVFESADLLVLPTMKAPPGLLEGENGPGRGNNNIAFNVSGLPAISVPCGFTAAGLPLGLQIVGPRFGDAAVLGLAHAFESAAGLGGRFPPLA